VIFGTDIDKEKTTTQTTADDTPTGIRPAVVQKVVKKKRTLSGIDVTPRPSRFVDGSVSYENGLNNLGTIQFYHIPTGKEMYFKAFIENFNDSYTSAWQETQVYGRMDPIPTFENTTRTITLDFTVPSSYVADAMSNMNIIDTFIQCLYPVYEDAGDAGGAKHVLSTAPVWRVKFGNLISKSNSGSTSVKKDGLVTYIKDFNFQPNLDEGFMFFEDQMYPKSFSVNLSLTILHEHIPGFVKENTPKFASGKHNFPYGVGDPDDVTSADKGVTNVVQGPPVANNAQSRTPRNGLDKRLLEPRLNA
jgi:hypothetical protein